MEPLNIHYHDFEDIQLADPSRIEQLYASTISLTRRLNRNVALRRKRRTRQKNIERRQDLCKLFDRMYLDDSAKPLTTQRNLDESPFLALPFELRQYIYELYYEPYSAKLQDLTYDGTFLLTDFQPCSKAWPPGRGPSRNIFSNLLGLPLTCRIIYPEAMVHLYRKITLRFTDPQLAISLPEMMPKMMLHAVRSLDFSFFAHLFFKLEHSPKSKVVVASSPQQHRLKTWESLWTNLATSRDLVQISLKVFRHQGDSIQFHYVADMSSLLTVPISLSNAMLSPLLCFDRENGPQVALDLCWQPDHTLLESLNAAGFTINVNGRVAESI
jgi:hypothetical protein